MSGPSRESLVGHHLTEAIRHLYAAAEFTRDLDRQDAGELAHSIERAAESARDTRGEIEGPPDSGDRGGGGRKAAAQQRAGQVIPQLAEAFRKHRR